ncbi:spindle pole body component 110, partial [Striga asiatica]
SLPCASTNAKKSTPAYKSWWHQVHGGYLERHIEDLLASKPKVISSKDKELVVDEGDPASEDDDALLARIPGNSKRKSGSTSLVESSNPDRHWKRTKRTTDSSQHVEKTVENQHETEDLIAKAQRDVFGSDDDEESQDDEATSVANVPTCAKKLTAQQNLHTPAASEFKGEKFILDRQKKYLQGMWHDLRDKVMATPIDFLSSIKEEVSLVFDAMRQCDKCDLSTIESSFKVLFDNADSYDGVRSKSSEKATKEHIARQLAEAKDRLCEDKAKEDTESNQVKSTQDELKRVTEELEQLKTKAETLSKTLKQQQESLDSAKAQVKLTQENILAISSAPSLDEEVVEQLKMLKSNLKATKEKLGSLNLFV